MNAQHICSSYKIKAPFCQVRTNLVRVQAAYHQVPCCSLASWHVIKVMIIHEKIFYQSCRVYDWRYIIFRAYRNTGPYQYNIWLDHRMADLDLMVLQNIPHWMAKMQYVSSVRQASTANALPRLTKTYFVIASCV